MCETHTELCRCVYPDKCFCPPEAKQQESSSEFAKHVIAEVDTYGDPRIYRLAEDYLRLEDKIRRAIESMPAVSATYAAYAILTGVFDA